MYHHSMHIDAAIQKISTIQYDTGKSFILTSLWASFQFSWQNHNGVTLDGADFLHIWSLYFYTQGYELSFLNLPHFHWFLLFSLFAFLYSPGYYTYDIPHMLTMLSVTGCSFIWSTVTRLHTMRMDTLA